MAKKSSWKRLVDLTPFLSFLFGVGASLGTVYVYFTHESQLQEVSLALGKADTELREIQVKQVQHQLNSRIVLTPYVRILHVDGSLRQLQFRLEVANRGGGEAKIGPIGVTIYRGELAPSAAQVVANANELLLLEQTLPWGSLSDNASTLGLDLNPEQQRLLERYNSVHVDCPHGRLLFLDNSDSDFTWKEVAALDKQEQTSLAAEQEVHATFTILSTHFYGHPIWIRLVPRLTVDGKEKTMGEEIVSLDAIHAVEASSQQASYTVRQYVRTREADQPYSRSPIFPAASTEVTRASE